MPVDNPVAGGATEGASEGLNQAAAAAVVIANGGSESLTQSSAIAIVIAAGASQGLTQGAAARVIAYAGASHNLTQSAGAVAVALAGASQGLTQSAGVIAAGATLVTEAGASQGLTQSAGAATVIARGGSEGLTQSSGLAVTVSVVTAAGASYSVAQVAGTVAVDAPVTPPSTGSGGVAGPGRVYVLPHSGDQEGRIRFLESAEKPNSVLQLKPRPAKQAKETGGDLKALRDRLLDLGRALERNKQSVKDRIKAEQARPDSPELMGILQLLIDEYELTLYNQNAARLLIILADDR